LTATACLILLAGILEIGQSFSVGRDPTLEDFCASALGAIIGAAIVFAISGTADVIRAYSWSPPRRLTSRVHGVRKIGTRSGRWQARTATDGQAHRRASIGSGPEARVLSVLLGKCPKIAVRLS